MTLAATVAALRTVVDTIDGVRVYPNPPESINEFPSAIVYSASGEMQFGSSGLTRNYHTLNVDIYLARQILPQAIDAAKAYPDLMYTAVSNAYSASTIDIVDTNGRAAISYRTGPMNYNNITHTGIRFTIRLKEVVTG